jgi:dTDP-glucose 4,6-dehydratase
MDDLVSGRTENLESIFHVSDLIDGLLALMRSDVQTPVNVGNPDERSIKELAEVTLDVTDSESDITFEARPEQDPAVRRPDLP